MNNKILKSEKGLSGIDVGIATVVIVIFVSIITTLSYQIYSVTVQTKRNSEATANITNILENIKGLNYDDVIVQENSKISEVLEKLGAKEIQVDNSNKCYNVKIDGYKITIKIENYRDDIKHDTSLEDVVKQITVKAEYEVTNKQKTLEIKTIITKAV